MKVAVTAQGESLDAQVDPRFGRGAAFVIVDTDTDDCAYLDNSQNVNAAQGAGVQAAQAVINRGVDALVTGHCGPNAFRTLSQAGVKVYVGAEGTVREAIEKLKAGELKEADSPDVQGHW